MAGRDSGSGGSVGGDHGCALQFSVAGTQTVDGGAQRVAETNSYQNSDQKKKWSRLLRAIACLYSFVLWCPEVDLNPHGIAPCRF